MSAIATQHESAGSRNPAHDAADLAKQRGRLAGQRGERAADPADLRARAGRGDFRDAKAAHDQRAGIDTRSPVSPASSPAVALSTGSDSPVRIDSSTLSAVALRSTPSAGTRSPSRSSTTSPTTTSRPAMRCSTPSRMHQRARARQVAQRGQRVLGAPLLQNRDRNDDEDRDGEDQGFADVAQHHIDRRRRDQQQKHRFGQHFARDRSRAPLVARQLVGSAGLKAPGGFRSRQAAAAPGRVCEIGGWHASHLSGTRRGARDFPRLCSPAHDKTGPCRAWALLQVDARCVAEPRITTPAYVCPRSATEPVMKRFIVCLAILSATAACSVEPSRRSTGELSGVELYEELCASCHGVSGHGDGPVAPLIKIGVPDLTRLAHRDGGEFPTEDVRRTIDGRWDRTAHGARDMPVWGWQFYNSSQENDAAERARVDSIIDRLVEYLRSIQVE